MKKIFLFLMTILGLNACMNARNAGYTNMDVAQFEALLNDTKDIQLVDVRTPSEYDEGHIADAQNIDWFDKNFMTQVSQSLDKNKPVAVYCRSGKRSAAAATRLTGAGYKVINLEGGILAWLKDNKPVVTE